ncbi:hypothetical protein [Actinomadura sp. SCN-SB]|uniref:hypothetical protein n=1 Tax=Actinomadura sp. SCN-SB TaxID=3373092 RepID=UPI003750321C
MGHPRNLPPLGTREVRIDHDTLKDIARILRADMNNLHDGRWKEKIDDSFPPVEAMGDYTAGRSLHQTIRNARDQIGNTHQAFVQAYEAVITALENSEQNYRDADDNSAAGVRNRARLD